MRKTLQYILKFFSIIVLKKYSPAIIAVTGSVGKTSTKEAIYAVLNYAYPGNVRKSWGNFNTEIGVPLTIFGLNKAGSSALLWISNFFHILGIILKRDKEYPDFLIIEMGADKPYDIEYLTGFVKPDIAVVTAISDIPVHIEFFKNIDELKKEKSYILKSLSKNGTAILCYDDASVRNMDIEVPENRRTMTYGFEVGSYVRGVDYRMEIRNPEQNEYGISFKVLAEGNNIPVKVKGVLGKGQAYALLAGISVGLVLGVGLNDAARAVKKYRSPVGRVKLIKGVKNTYIIDDTYNASPSSVMSALEILQAFPAKRKIAVLGDMLELGQYTEKAHRRIGRMASQFADLMFTVGLKSVFIKDEAIKNGFSETKVFSFDSSQKAAKKVQEKLQEGDVVLVKGSRGVKMERIVLEIMREPEKAKVKIIV